MNNRTLLVFIAIIMIITASCKKSSTAPHDRTFTLNTLSVSGNKITLDWTRLNNDSLTSYTIVGVSIPTDSAGNLQTVYSRTVDKSLTQYTDTFPVAPYIKYTVVANLTSSSITSNVQTYTRPDFAGVNAIDALYDKTAHQLYIYGTSNIMQFDIVGKKILSTVAFPDTIGFCDLGTYNGTKELYIPHTNGSLSIYNATTLTPIDQVNITAIQANCVVNSNGILYVSLRDTSKKYYVSAYSRATKNVLSQTYGAPSLFIKQVPNSNSTFFGITNSATYYYKFDTIGNNILQFNSALPDAYYNYPPMAVFPDGSKFISCYNGQVVDKNMMYITALPATTSLYSCFAIDSTNGLIYAGSATQKTISVFSMSNYQLARTMTTQGYPVKLFYDNGTLISVSNYGAPSFINGFPYATSGYAFVEQF